MKYKQSKKQAIQAKNRIRNLRQQKRQLKDSFYFTNTLASKK